MKKWFHRIESFLWPERCVFCRRVLPFGENVCKECCGKIAPEFIRFYVDAWNKSGAFQCVSVYPYVDLVRKAIHRFKFGNRPGYAAFFGSVMAKAVSLCFSDVPFDFITAVPLSPKSQRERGYNQSNLLAEKIADILGIPFREALCKIRENVQQHTLKGLQRHQNVLGAYALLPKENVKGKRVLLVDDVITTGNTVSECAKVLKKHGAEEVICVSIARVL